MDLKSAIPEHFRQKTWSLKILSGTGSALFLNLGSRLESVQETCLNIVINN